MTVLFQSEHALFEVDHGRRIVRYTRSAVPFATLDDATRTFRALGETKSFDRSKYGLLSDVRNAPGRNDPAFEAAIMRHRNDLFEGFARRATLVRTMAGQLQVQRLAREQHAPELRVFHDEQEAIAYLTGH
jgi:hypothetical protein